MPRPRTIDAFERVRMLHDYGILAVHTGKKAEILEVKHVTFGWISASGYNTLRMLNAAKPFIVEIVKGGYALKSRLWSVQIPLDVLASGSAIPFGLVLVAIAFVIAAYDYGVGSSGLMVALDIACLFIPFGEVWLVYRLVLSLKALGSDLQSALNNPFGDVILSMFGGGSILFMFGEGGLFSQGVKDVYSWLASL
jgi:hypothetical protein